jgi:hypothetical protein
MCDCSKPLRNPPEANRGFRVEMTVPEKPNSRLQRYRLTDKGKTAFRKGFE